MMCITFPGCRKLQTVELVGQAPLSLWQGSIATKECWIEILSKKIIQVFFMKVRSTCKPMPHQAGAYFISYKYLHSLKGLTEECDNSH